jgi:hypothetical protein
MTVLVVFDSHLLQILNEVEEIPLEFRLVYLYFALDQILEGGRPDHRHQMLDSLLRLAISKNTISDFGATNSSQQQPS